MFFKTGTVLVDETGTFIADIKSFIMLETESAIEVTFLLDGEWKKQNCQSLLLIYGDIGRVWIRSIVIVDSKIVTTRVNYYISTDDGEASGHIKVIMNEKSEPLESKVLLKVLPTRTDKPDIGLPVKDSNLTFGILQESTGIPAQSYSGVQKDIPVHTT